MEAIPDFFAEEPRSMRFFFKSTVRAALACALIFSAGCGSEKKDQGADAHAEKSASLQPGYAGGHAGEVNFNQHVRPIISEFCFQCHGPDAENQESPFRLDSAEASRMNLSAEGDPPRYGIVPGNPDESLIMQRILHEEVPTLFVIGRRTIDVRRSSVHGWKAHSQSWSGKFDTVWKS